MLITKEDVVCKSSATKVYSKLVPTAESATATAPKDCDVNTKTSPATYPAPPFISKEFILSEVEKLAVN